MMLGRAGTVGLASAELVILSNAQNVVLSALPWRPGVFASVLGKQVIVPAGVTIGSLNPSSPALDTGTGWGGSLDLVISGSVEGAGGVLNGGAGGDALLARANGGNKLRLTNAGLIAGGGGGGGAGGAGGGGYFLVTHTEGQFFNISGPHTYFYRPIDGPGFVWDGVFIGGTTPVASGGYIYYQGSYSGSGTLYYVYRTYQTTTFTSGGAGGAGGRGRGYTQSLAAGSPGSAGGTNAGTGGTGGTGGDRGLSGTGGSTGSAGNNGAGSGGGNGGLAGFGLNGTANVDVLATGTILGR